MKNIGTEAAAVYAYVFTEKFRKRLPVFVMYIILILIVGTIITSRAAVFLWKKAQEAFNAYNENR